MAKHNDRFDNGAGEHVRAAQSVQVVLTGQASGNTATFDLAALAAAQGLRALPTSGHKILGQYIEVVTPVTLGGTTTGLAAVGGISGTTNGFMTTASLLSIAAGVKSDLGGPGTLVGRLRNATTHILTVTASGGAADVDEITAGEIIVHTEYVVCKGVVA